MADLLRYTAIPEGGTDKHPSVYTAIRSAFREIAAHLTQPPAPLGAPTRQTETPQVPSNTGVLYVLSYTVATLPSAGQAAGIVFVSNESGGAVLAYSDGTNWRRVTDRAIVS